MQAREGSIPAGVCDRRATKPAGRFQENPPGGGSFVGGLRWLGRCSPLRGCAGLTAWATTKIPPRRTPRSFRTGSESWGKDSSSTANFLGATVLRTVDGSSQWMGVLSPGFPSSSQELFHDPIAPPMDEMNEVFMNQLFRRFSLGQIAPETQQNHDWMRLETARRPNKESKACQFNPTNAVQSTSVKGSRFHPVQKILCNVV